MTLDELAKLVRDTAKEMNLMLDKVVCHETKMPLSVGVKAKATDPVEPHVCFEIINGMKMGRQAIGLKLVQNARVPRGIVIFHLRQAAAQAGMIDVGATFGKPVWTTTKMNA